MDRPNYMNYASIGSIIGHEITHGMRKKKDLLIINSPTNVIQISVYFKFKGFDDQGRQYDADGNLANWWDEITERQFLEKVKCIIDQYSNYTDLKTNLTVTRIRSLKIPYCL